MVEHKPGDIVESGDGSIYVYDGGKYHTLLETSRFFVIEEYGVFPGLNFAKVIARIPSEGEDGRNRE